MDKLLEQQVRERARGRCEYCHIPTSLYDQPFHLDHIIARKHGGQSVLENLAFCCIDCNLHKGTNIAGIDRGTGALTRLLNPRMDQWAMHLAWRGAELIGLSAIGRTTIEVLQINQAIRVTARAIFIEEGSFPNWRDQRER